MYVCIYALLLLIIIYTWNPVSAMGKPNVKRLVASWDANGWLRVLKDDGSVRISTHCNSSLLTARYRGSQIYIKPINMRTIWACK